MNKSAQEIHNLIRGLSPYPTAFTYLDGKILKIYKSEESVIKNKDDGNLSEISLRQLVDRNDIAIKTDHKTYLSFKCADAYLDILELQLEGKKRMKVDEFLRGYKFSIND